MKKKFGIVSISNDNLFDEIEQEHALLQEIVKNNILLCEEYTKQCLSLSNKNKTLVGMFRDLFTSFKTSLDFQNEYQESQMFCQRIESGVKIIRKTLLNPLKEIDLLLNKTGNSLKKRKRKLIDVQRKKLALDSTKENTKKEKREKKEKSLEIAIDVFEKYNEPLKNQTKKLFNEIRSLFVLFSSLLRSVDLNLFSSFKQINKLETLKESWEERTSFSAAIINRIISSGKQEENKAKSILQIPPNVSTSKENNLQQKATITHNIFLPDNIELTEGQSVNVNSFDAEVAQIDVCGDSVLIPLSCLSLNEEKEEH